jgi:anti-sigma-K factor RskA
MSDDRLTRDELAIDHALGLTDGANLERAERLEQTDGVFRHALADWRHKLSELDQTAAASAPRNLTWEKLEAALLVTPVLPSTVINPATAAESVSSWWERLSFWRPAALAAGLSVAILGGVLIAQLTGPPIQPVYVAVLQTGDGRAAAVVNAFADGTVTLVPLEIITAPEGRVLEVWTLQSREQGPISIGRMDRARTMKLDLKQLKRPDAGHLFEITIEPTGGSPTGRPTGPILMKGLASGTI